MTTVSVDGCEISYEVSGSGRPVVFIHGLGGSKGIWQPIRSRLESDFQIIAMDLRGAGATRETVKGELSLALWANDLRGFLAGLRVEHPVLAGHSLGASIALKYASLWPHDVDALVLMGADANLARLEGRMRKTVELVGSFGLSSWVDEHWSKNPPFSGASLARRPDILDSYRAMVLENDAEDYVRTCLAIASAEDMSDALAELPHRALVIVGDEDDRTLPEDGRAIAARIVHATLLEVPDAGHSLPLEAPDEVAGAIASFLDGWVPGGGRR